VASKACVACNREIPAAFQKCSSCGAAQPNTSQAPAAKEKRCSTCRSPYSAKLEECPFCARDRATGVQPSAFGATRTSLPAKPLREDAAAAEEPAGDRTLGSAALFGVPLLVAGIWGVARVVYAQPLGPADSAWAGRGVVVALLVAISVGLGFVRRARGPLADAVEEVGLPKVVATGVIASAVAFVPAVYFVAGAVQWLNTFGIEERAQLVDCKVASMWSVPGKYGEGWYLTYACDLGGEHVFGTSNRLAAKPALVEGGVVRFRAGSGRLGRWVRLSDPLPPTELPVP
jgi:hypothetical protein